MMVVYHETLPESYLLVLAPSSNDPWATELAYYLSCACRSGKPAVWVDCRLLDELPVAAARLLWASHLRLHRRHVQLVLCRVSEALEQALRRAGPGPDLCLVPTLDDAAEQSGRWAA